MQLFSNIIAWAAKVSRYSAVLPSMVYATVEQYLPLTSLYYIVFLIEN